MSKFVVAIAAAALFPLAAQADLVYSVNRTIGGGSVTGSITTNGDLGDLQQNDIVGFQLTLDVSGAYGPVTITNANSSVTLIGGAVSADEDSIDFNFAGAIGQYLLFAKNSGPFDRWCVQTTNCSTFVGPSEAVGTLSAAATFVGDTEGRTLAQPIATRDVNPVPEPASLLLTALGLMGMAATRRRHA